MIRPFLCAALLLATSAVNAQTTTNNNLTNTATVVRDCSIAVSRNLSFGAFDYHAVQVSKRLDAEGAVSVTCTPGSYTVAIGNGNKPFKSGNLCFRRMQDETNVASTNAIMYVLYTGSQRTQAQEYFNTTGSCASAPNTVYKTLNFTAGSTERTQTVPVYGSILSHLLESYNPLAVGRYSDSISVLVTF